MRNNALGVYVSIPFCRSKCTYCNFASGVYPASEHTRYVRRLTEELAGAGDWAAGQGLELPPTVDTIYLGGGTPSLLEPELIQQLFEAIRAEFEVLPGAEITVECAPGQIAQPTLEAMAAAGVNRVSLGVQSFIDKEAHASGRLHSRAAVLDDLRRLRAAGIANINLDLIAGLGGQTFASWDESVTVLLETGVPHASVYMLEVDEDSRLGREMLAGGARYSAGLVPSDDAIARMYETAVERLAGAGLEQYEISNFAQKGRESRHNLRYWERRPYLGVGLDASSMLVEAESKYSPQRMNTESVMASGNGTAEQLAERGDLATRARQGLKPGVDLIELIGPTEVVPLLQNMADGLFPARCEAVPLLQNRVDGTFSASCEAAPLQNHPASGLSAGGEAVRVQDISHGTGEKSEGGEKPYVLRATTSDDLKGYLEGGQTPKTAWLSPERQHEEAWFLGLRTNAGVDAAALELEFGAAMVGPALETARRLVEDGLLVEAAGRFRLTGRGRLISNDVFGEFLEEQGVGSRDPALTS